MVKNYNTLDDSSKRISVQNETENINLTAFIIIFRINKTKVKINIFHVTVDVQK